MQRKTFSIIAGSAMMAGLLAIPTIATDGTPQDPRTARAALGGGGNLATPVRNSPFIVTTTPADPARARSSQDDGGLAGAGNSFNIDVDTAVIGHPADGVPVSTYGAAAAQPGVWNLWELQVNATLALVDLSGDPTGVTITRADPLAGNGNFAFDNLDSTGDFQLLMDDGYDLSGAGGGVLTIAGLPAGDYSVYTYAWAPDFPPDSTTVTVNTAGSQAVANGPGTSFVLGGNYAKHDVTIASGENIVITADGTAAADFGTINGVQVVAVGGAPCPADLNNSGQVDVDDLIAVILGWGTAAGDTNGDGTTDVDDLIAVILGWGPCP